MKHLIIILGGLFTLGNADLCSDNVTMYELPAGPLNSLMTLYTVGTTVSFAGCSKNYVIDTNKIVFWLYNREHYHRPIRLVNYNTTGLDSSLKTIFILHGWACNITGYKYPEMKDAYLQRYPDCNVIFIEWATYAVDYYVNSFCYSPLIAKHVAKFICYLNMWYNLDFTNLHFIGHSMGAQIAGLIGQETQTLCAKKVGRITALDPAGPLYQIVPKSRRLDASDATIVDVIHTNQGSAGYYGACGTVDYYPNCGYHQPGCFELTPTTNITKLLNIPFHTFHCSHIRSIYYFLESISTDIFKAKSCTLCPGAVVARVCLNDIFYGSTSIMGEGYYQNPGTSARYYIKTNNKPPYALT